MLTKKIIDKLRLFQYVYDKKDIDNIDTFMKEFFVADGNVSILGTSFGEFCLGYEQCKNLLISDFKHWSFEELDLMNIEIREYGEFIFVYTPATFSFVFETTNEKYKSYLDFILDTVNNHSKDLRNPIIKYSEVNWILDHFLHFREDKSRKYLLDLSVCFIFKQINDDYFVSQIQFSVPSPYNSDLRLYENDDSGYENDLVNKTTSVNSEVENFFKEFVANFTDLSHFSDNLFVLNVNKEIATNKTELSIMHESQKINWDKIELENGCYVEENNQSGLFIAYARVKKVKNKETYISELQNKISNINKEDITVLDKLFKIRQSISSLFKDTSIGDEYDYPLRIHSIVRKEDGIFKINYLQYSYPLYYILENKNDFMIRV